MNENESIANKETNSKEISEYVNSIEDNYEEYDSTVLKYELNKLDWMYQQKCKECEMLEQQISLFSNNDEEYTNDIENEYKNDDVDALSKNITLIDQIEKLNYRIEVIENEKRELVCQVQQYQKYIEEIESERSNLEETISNLNDCKSLDNTLNTNYTNLLNENNKIKEENERYKRELIAKEKEINILSNEIKNIERINLIEKHHNEYQAFIENKIEEMMDMLSNEVDLNKMEELTKRMVEISNQLKEREKELEKNEDIIIDLSNQLAEMEEDNSKLKELLPYRLGSDSFASIGSNDYPYSPSLGSTGEFNDYISNSHNLSPNHDRNNDSSIKIEIIDSIEGRLLDLRRKEELIDESDEKKDKMEEEINRMNKLMEETNKELENIEKSINEIKSKVDTEIKQSKDNFS